MNTTPFLLRVQAAERASNFVPRAIPLPGECCVTYTPRPLYAEGWAMYGGDPRLLLWQGDGTRYVLWAYQNFLGQISKYFVRDNRRRYEIYRRLDEGVLKTVELDPAAATDHEESQGYGFPWDFSCPFFYWDQHRLEVSPEGLIAPVR